MYESTYRHSACYHASSHSVVCQLVHCNNMAAVYFQGGGVISVVIWNDLHVCGNKTQSAKQVYFIMLSNMSL